MAFVKARRGDHVVKVSRKSFETMYKNHGYVLEGQNRKPQKEEKKQEVIEEVEEATEEVEETPISDMTKEQLAEFAKAHNIDTSAARNVGEARKIVQKAIREAKM
jgi:hypothetical protein